MVAVTANFGDVPSWISALGSLLALAFAAAAVVAAWRTWRIESARDQVAAEQRDERVASERQRQAAMVSTWWGQEAATGTWGAFVRNASGTPVYQVYLNVLDANDAGELPFARIRHFVLAPSDVAVFSTLALPAGTQNQDLRVELYFTDAAGVRWQRNRFGRLSELEPTLHVKLYEARAAVLTAFAPDFLGTYGVSVSFDTDADVIAQQEFRRDVLPQPAAPDGGGDAGRFDAMICPHDWLGDFVARDVIEPILLAPDQEAKLTPWMLSAVSAGNRLLALPVAADTVALIRNTRLAPDLPASFDDLIAKGRALQNAGQVSDIFALRVGESGDPFQLWPLFASAGGRLFGRAADGSWDPRQVGLDSPEGIEAFERLRAMGESGTGMLRRSLDRDAAFDLFAAQRTAFLLSSSDALRPLRRAGIPIEVSAVPPFLGGGPATPFALVQGLCVLRQGKGRAIAHDLFADYLTRERVVGALSDGIAAPTALSGLRSKDPAVEAFRELCERAMPMPAFPQMERVWRILEHAELEVLTGAAADVTAREAAAAVRAAFA